VKTPTILPLIMMLFITVPFSGMRSEAPDDTRAAEVMSKVVAAYHSLSSYGDKGSSIVHLASVNYRVEFEALFKRPEGCVSHGPLNIVKPPAARRVI